MISSIRVNLQVQINILYFECLSWDASTDGPILHVVMKIFDLDCEGRICIINKCEIFFAKIHSG